MDANGNLKPEYDAAHVNLGGNWRMPTEGECKELIDNCTCTWSRDYEGTGVCGSIFTSKKEGYMDKSIFLPSDGYGSFGGLYMGDHCCYWSSTLGSGENASHLSASTTVYMSQSGIGLGFLVRPVKE